MSTDVDIAPKPLRRSGLSLIAGAIAASLLGPLAPAPVRAEGVTAERAGLSGIWLVDQGANIARASDGSPAPLNAAGLTLFRQRESARASGDVTQDNTTWCAAPGMPRIMLIRYPFEIIVRPRAVFFHYQWDRWTRFADMSGEDLAVIDQSAMGVSTGRWDGDTLVIRTYGLRDDTFLDNAGLPHSADMTVTERLRLVGEDVLEDLIQIEDPAYYTGPWTMRVTYNRQAATEIEEDVCQDRVSSGQPAIADK